MTVFNIMIKYMRPGEKSPWQLALNVTGFAGKKQGVTGGISVAFLF